MAEIAFTEAFSEYRTRVFKWAGVTEADQFGHVALGALPAHLSMILNGTPGGASFALQGAHDPSGPWVTVNRPPDALTEAATHLVSRDGFPFMRPRRSGGSGTSVDVTLAVTRAS